MLFRVLLGAQLETPVSFEDGGNAWLELETISKLPTSFAIEASGWLNDWGSVAEPPASFRSGVCCAWLGRAECVAKLGACELTGTSHDERAASYCIRSARLRAYLLRLSLLRPKPRRIAANTSLNYSRGILPSVVDSMLS